MQPRYANAAMDSLVPRLREVVDGLWWLVCSSALFLGALVTIWRGCRHG